LRVSRISKFPGSVSQKLKTENEIRRQNRRPALGRVFKTVRFVFSHYLPIETLAPQNQVYDPFAVVPPFLKQVREAIAQTA